MRTFMLNRHFSISFPSSPMGMHTPTVQDKGRYAAYDRSICIPTQERGNEGNQQLIQGEKT